MIPAIGKDEYVRRCVDAVTDRFRDGKGLVKLLKKNSKTMSEYKIYNNMDTGDIMDCLSECEKINFAYECFECLELYQR